MIVVRIIVGKLFKNLQKKIRGLLRSEMQKIWWFVGRRIALWTWFVVNLSHALIVMMLHSQSDFLSNLIFLKKPWIYFVRLQFSIYWSRWESWKNSTITRNKCGNSELIFDKKPDCAECSNDSCEYAWRTPIWWKFWGGGRFGILDAPRGFVQNV